MSEDHRGSFGTEPSDRQRRPSPEGVPVSTLPADVSLVKGRAAGPDERVPHRDPARPEGQGVARAALPPTDAGTGRAGSLAPRTPTARQAPRPTGRKGPGPDTRPGPRPDSRPGREPRNSKAARRSTRLAVKRLNLASVFMTSLAISALLGIVLVVAAVVLYGVLDSSGAIGSVNKALAEVNVARLPTSGSVVTYAFVLAAVDVVLLTVIATLSAALYNLVASFTGGIEVTLVDD